MFDIEKYDHNNHEAFVSQLEPEDFKHPFVRMVTSTKDYYDVLRRKHEADLKNKTSTGGEE